MYHPTVEIFKKKSTAPTVSNIKKYFTPKVRREEHSK